MSDTSPKNQNVLLAGHVQSASMREPRAGTQLWRLVKHEDVMVCEFLDDSAAGAGIEVRLRRNGELLTGHRCDTEAMARYVAEAFAQDHLRTGWTAIATELGG